ncbi:cyclopropane-fatty-acyl-phospholipid synthase family protein [Methyloceanibacter sp. wino2]|uniref:SAM-dependent methyltransferase n=1 Tax=Methyloceanibacter sp. wino2 TaxID=2170729 RepID=UPI001FE1F763|nr:cyclopropane-fatty-acyl-phospholipid synthase family protein [Methyloceanibacter sp. wino2]
MTRVVVGIGERLLTWQPIGSLSIVLPNGQRVRFGNDRPHDAVLTLKNYRVLRKAFRRGALGFAEAYMDGDVDCSDLVGLFRFVLRNQAALNDSGRSLFSASVLDRIGHFQRRNTRQGSRRNITEHYDLGNAFFEAWLDKELLYSSALYEDGTATLEAAQEAKLRAILDSLRLEPGMSMLEIGAGWGALALAAARDHGVSVHGITLSHEQLAHARARAEREGLDEQARFDLKDYRDVTGLYDRIVSVEMIEAVGEQNWPRYFRTLHDRLKPGGTATLQAITIGEAHFETYRRQPDFIQRYIFPGGMLPTKSILAEQARAAGFHYEPVLAFGPSYARTLSEWRVRFEAAWAQIEALGFDERFRRKWLYYLAYCEAGFLEGSIDVGLYRLTRD